MEGSKSAGFLPPCWLLVALGKLLSVPAVRRDEGASERVKSRRPGSRERQGLESGAAQCLRRCRSVSCATAACDAVEPSSGTCFALTICRRRRSGSVVWPSARYGP
eukprot:2769777-Pleurochrysis_carterae.AAC.2